MNDKNEKTTMPQDKVVVRGLEGVIAAETRISWVDGAQGQLYYQGYSIHQLAEKVSYDEVVYLLWNGELPTLEQLNELKKQLIAEMCLPAPVYKWLRSVPRKTLPIAVLRTAVSMLGLYDPEAEDMSVEANKRKAIRLVAKVPYIVAVLHSFRHGRTPLEPNPDWGVAQNFITIFEGKEMDEVVLKAMDLLFVLHADHGMNASTFTARVISSTLADMYGAVAGAVASLKGPLHGGANQKVMEMLEDIEHPKYVDLYIDGLLSDKQRIMGFGHRVYRTQDPRGIHLKRWAEKLCVREEYRKLYEISHRIEKKVKKAKGIYPNVDFYSALVQHVLGFSKIYFPAVFACGRVSGWTAHILEQLADNRLIRPTSRYLGAYGRRFVPIEKRGEKKKK